MAKAGNPSIRADGTLHGERKDFCPFPTFPPEAYIPILGEERVERLQKIAQWVKGLKMLTLNATARGGGVADKLYSAIPFLNMLGVETEWKVICGTREYFEATKELHNLLQGKRGSFTPELRQVCLCTLEECARQNFIDYKPDVIDVHDPLPLGLGQYLRGSAATWLWRCHIGQHWASALVSFLVVGYLKIEGYKQLDTYTQAIETVVTNQRP